MQSREIELLNSLLLQGVEQRIDPGHCGERSIFQLFDQPRDITRGLVISRFWPPSSMNSRQFMVSAKIMGTAAAPSTNFS